MNLDIEAIIQSAESSLTEHEKELSIAGQLLSALKREHRRAQLMASVVDDMYHLRVAVLPPHLSESAQAKAEEFRAQNPDFGTSDIGYLFTVVSEHEDLYRRMADRNWSEMTPEEKDQAETLTFVHNFVKLLALWHGDAHKLVADLQTEAFYAGATSMAEQISEDHFGGRADFKPQFENPYALADGS